MLLASGAYIGLLPQGQLLIGGSSLPPLYDSTNHVELKGHQPLPQAFGRWLAVKKCIEKGCFVVALLMFLKIFENQYMLKKYGFTDASSNKRREAGALRV